MSGQNETMQKVGQILTEKKHKYLMNIEVCQTGLSQSLKRPVISGGNLNLFGSDNVVTSVKVKAFHITEVEMSVIGSVKCPKARLNLLRMHRFLQFEHTFDKYLAGEVPAAYFTARAKAMLSAGLPRLR